MREINVSVITDAVKRLCMDANYHLPSDIKNCSRLLFAKGEYLT